jgi:hypothetical protein
MSAEVPIHIRRRRRQRLALLIYFACLLVFCLAGAELVARWRGARPYRSVSLATRIEPGQRLFQTHPVLGYTHLPGQFLVTLNAGASNACSFQVTHDTNSLRITHPPRAAAPGRPGLWIFGCSFTHGWSLGDAETFPWQVQSAVPDWEVSNFGVNGYGTLHSLLQYRLQAANAHPRIVVATYAYFHPERSALLRGWRKSIVPFNQLGLNSLPYAKLAEDGSLDIRQSPAVYYPWPGQGQSALVHLLERNWNAWEERRLSAPEFSLALLRQFARECQSNQTAFVVAGITRGRETADVLRRCQAEGLRTVDISVSLSEPGSRNLPCDDHPSARSQAHYAAELLRYLRAQNLVAPAR